jgi:hypothetical protein
MMVSDVHPASSVSIEPQLIGWHLLPAEQVRHVASFMEPNEVVCNLRLLDKATAKILEGWTTVRLSQPVPHHAFASHWRDEDSTRVLSLKQRQQLLCTTARSGSVANLEVAFAAAGCNPTVCVGNAAAAAGHVHICEWLHSRGVQHGSIFNAARSGSSAMVRWVSQQVADPHDRGYVAAACMVAAAGSGHRMLCEELLAEVAQEGRAETLQSAACRSAEDGHLDLALWLLDQLGDAKGFYGYLLRCASYGMDLPALQQLCGSALLQRARSDSQEEVMRQSGLDIACAALASATPDWCAKLEWLEDTLGVRARPGDATTTTYCLKVLGRPDAVARTALLRQWGVFPDSSILGWAITSDSLPVVRCLLSEGGAIMGALVKDLTEAAARAGHLAVLAELLAAGCPIGPEAVWEAARGGYLQVLRWLAGPEAGLAAAEALRAAEGNTKLTCHGTKSGSLELMQWLKERDCQWDEAAVFREAAGAGSVALLEWLASWGCSTGVSANLLFSYVSAPPF